MLRVHAARMTTSTRHPTKPAKSILDPAFRYRPSHATDVRETFERARRELGQGATSPATADRVVQLKKRESR